jgi:hypothetical protein
MADAVTSQTLIDGPRNAVMKFTNLSDATGEAAVAKVTASGLSGAPSTVRISRVWYDIVGMSVTILWDATTDVTALVLQGSGFFDFKPFGGLDNNAGAGVTGNILFTTTGHTAGDSYTILLEMEKS